MAALAGCGPARSQAGTVAPPATVTGYIGPCTGLPFPPKISTGARLFSAAATVEALRGREHQKPVGNVITSLDVSAAAGQIVNVDLPNTCK